MTDRQKLGVAFWATVVLAVVLVGYPLSVGPAAWIVEESKPGDWGWDVYHAAYYPLLRIYDLDYDYRVPESENGGGLFHRALNWYLSLWGGGPWDYVDT
jgi:hypothetical protein